MPKIVTLKEQRFPWHVRLFFWNQKRRYGTVGLTPFPWTAVPVANARVRDFAHARPQVIPRILDAAVVLRAASLLHQSAGPPLLQPVVAHDVTANPLSPRPQFAEKLTFTSVRNS